MASEALRLTRNRLVAYCSHERRLQCRGGPHPTRTSEPLASGEGGLSVSELSAPLGISRQATTKHLDLLISAGLVRQERRGRERLHHLCAEPLVDLADWLEPYRSAWDRQLERLTRPLDNEEEQP